MRKVFFSLAYLITNSAAIYFDFNPAIITNTFTSEFVHELGIGELDSEFRIYPNPASDLITISGIQEVLLRVTVYDMMGKTIVEKTAVPQLDISNLTAGVYILELTGKDNSRSVHKLIKQ